MTVPTPKFDRYRCRFRQWILWTGLLVALLCLVSCSSAPAADAPAEKSDNPTGEVLNGAENSGEQEESASSGDGVTEKPVPAAEKPPETQESIEIKWQESPHASSYVLDEAGKNDKCARCHAPVNWIPSMDEMPESCYACKFEVDPPPPLISESDWTHVECKVCHQMKKDQVQPEVSWLEIAQIEEYASVESVEKLCLKCHVPADVPGHLGILVEGAHAGMVCSDCHDAHNLTASCSEAGCHEAVDTAGAEIPGHDVEHQMVSCGACHDASGLDVGPDENGTWVTFYPESVSAEELRAGYASHNIGLSAACDRCHFADNPWSLSLVEDVAP
jgi:hypothetical protein